MWVARISNFQAELASWIISWSKVDSMFLNGKRIVAFYHVKRSMLLSSWVIYYSCLKSYPDETVRPKVTRHSSIMLNVAAGRLQWWQRRDGCPSNTAGIFWSPANPANKRLFKVCLRSGCLVACSAAVLKVKEGPRDTVIYVISPGSPISLEELVTTYVRSVQSILNIW